jgi:TolA-binding protein
MFNDLKNFLQWRKTWTLVALDVLMLSSVFSLAAAADLPAVWAACAAAVSTIMLFAIALYDWKKSAEEAADYAELREQVRQMERRVNQLEAVQLQAAE